MEAFFNDALDFARTGFAEVNAVQGLIVAIIAVLFMSKWGQWLVITAGAVVAHVALDILAPVFAESGPFRLPPVLEGSYWRYIGLLLAGYFIVIGVLFLLKKMLIRS